MMVGRVKFVDTQNLISNSIPIFHLIIDELITDEIEQTDFLKIKLYIKHINM